MIVSFMILLINSLKYLKGGHLVGKQEKRLKALRKLKHGQSAPINDVISLCEEHGIEIEHAKTGSHFKAKHKLAKAFGIYYNLEDVKDCLSIPERNKKVYHKWVARLIKFIDFKTDYERKENEKK
jgi:hypothetical protein